MMVRGVFAGTVAEQYEATQRFRKLLSIGEWHTGSPRPRRRLGNTLHEALKTY